MLKSIFLSIFCISTLFSAGPIGHLYFTDKLFAVLPKERSVNKNLFIVGTLYPDIRYLGVLERDNTHFSTMTLDDVMQDESPFNAGLKFHSWVDIERERFVENSGIYSVVKEYTSTHPETFLKFIEDELLFNEVERPSFPTPMEEELKFGVSEKDVAKWHYILSIFTSFKPSTVLWTFEMSGKGFGSISVDEIKRWNQVFSKAVEDDRLKTFVEKLKKDLSDKVERGAVVAR